MESVRLTSTTGRVGSGQIGRFLDLTGLGWVGSGQEVFTLSWVGSGHLAPARLDPRGLTRPMGSPEKYNLYPSTTPPLSNAREGWCLAEAVHYFMRSSVPINRIMFSNTFAPAQHDLHLCVLALNQVYGEGFIPITGTC